ncbi:MAG TPA: hypothetical protein VFM10_04980, partial [Terriglobales bacterium]|nr:hypothetical protein [Terriglobales bacterium]
MQVNTDLALESRNTYPVVAENSEQRRSLLSEVHARLIRIIDGHVVAGQVMIDFGILAFAVVAAFIIRFERIPTGHTGRLMLMWLPVLVCARLLVNWKAGVYSRMWRFFCLCDAVTIGSSLLPVTFVLLSLRVLYPEGSRFDQYMRLPFGVIALEFLVCLAALTGARVVRRILHERALKARLGPGKKCKRIVLYGAGRAGALLVKELADVPEVEIVGFVDDDPKKVGTLLSGVRVLGTGEALAKIVHTSGAEEV